MHSLNILFVKNCHNELKFKTISFVLFYIELTLCYIPERWKLCRRYNKVKHQKYLLYQTCHYYCRSILEETMGQKKIIGYMRVSTREQKEDRQKTALLKMGVPEKHIYMDKQSGRDLKKVQILWLLICHCLIQEWKRTF